MRKLLTPAANLPTAVVLVAVEIGQDGEMRSLLIAVFMAACGPVSRPVAPAVFEPVAPTAAVPPPARPSAVHVGKLTATTTFEDGHDIVVISGGARIYCQRRANQSDIRSCSFHNCDDCVEAQAEACFRVTRIMTGARESPCFDRIVDCEAVRLHMADMVDFKVDPECVITRVTQ